MDMSGMDMSGSSGGMDMTAGPDNFDMQRIFWTVISAAVGCAVAVNVFEQFLYRQRYVYRTIQCTVLNRNQALCSHA